MADHETVFDALAAIQANLPVVPRNSTATIQLQKGGSYSYDYANLTDVSDALLPRLIAEGLVWVCTPTAAPDGPALLIGRIHHLATGEFIEGSWPMPATTDSKQLGAAVTYGRRYLLCAMTGLVPDEDIDAQQPVAERPEPDTPPPSQHTFAELMNLIEQAKAAGVTGDYDATIQYVAEDNTRIDGAFRQIAAAFAKTEAGREFGDDDGY